jgi:DNA-directed RNA polymerase subunit E'/Rpb7
MSKKIKLSKPKKVTRDKLSPYENTEFTARVVLQPFQLDSELYIHLKNNLRKNVSGKCNEYGYIVRIFEVKKFEGGEIIPEDPMASILYNVTYTCRFCRPVINNSIIAVVSNINRSFIKANNGPISTFIPLNHIDTDKFIIDASDNVLCKASDNDKKDRRLKVGDIIKFMVLATRFYAGSSEMKVIGKLLDVASEKEKKVYESDVKYGIEEDKFVDPSKINQAIFASSVGDDADGSVLEVDSTETKEDTKSSGEVIATDEAVESEREYEIASESARDNS